MLNLTYDEKIHLDKWDIDVKPYLTVDQIDLIYDMIKDEPNPLLRERMIMANVLVACTDLYDDAEADYTYEQMLYSGLWDDILLACPNIQSAINMINNAVCEYYSVAHNFMNVVNAITNCLEDVIEIIDSDKLNNILRSTFLEQSKVKE